MNNKFGCLRCGDIRAGDCAVAGYSVTICNDCRNDWAEKMVDEPIILKQLELHVEYDVTTNGRGRSPLEIIEECTAIIVLYEDCSKALYRLAKEWCNTPIERDGVNQ